MHFSTSSTSAPQMEPSAGGIFTKRSLLFMPRPQVALQTSHSPHSVTRQLLGAEPAKVESRFSDRAVVLITELPQGHGGKKYLMGGGVGGVHFCEISQNLRKTRLQRAGPLVLSILFRCFSLMLKPCLEPTTDLLVN